MAKVIVQSTAFLALEASLSLRLTSTLKAVTFTLYGNVQKAIDAKNWEEAHHLIRSLDLSQVFTRNEDYIRYLSKVAILFGASRVTRSPGTSAVGLGFESEAINQWVETFRLSMQYNLQESLIEKGLQLIALEKSKHEVSEEKFSIILRKPDLDRPRYLGDVLKADKKKPAILPFSSFMDKDGKAKFNIASSLHTSRLSAFGYTAEAEYLGITTYQINEQLDSRICPICTLMHHKVFKVSDARNLLDMVIRTQDPDELKSLQPWPSQSAESLKRIGAMTTEEIVAHGWHVPPFHPRCRGLLSKSGTVPPLTAGKPVPVKLENYIATKEDFLQFGINLSPAKINLWNSLIQTSPADFLAKLLGVTSDQLLAEILGNPQPQSMLGISDLSVNQNGVHVELQKSVFGSKHPVIQDYYFRKSLSLFVGLIKSHVSDAKAVKKVLKNLYYVANDTSMKSIEMVSDDNLSGYAFAKYGFSLSPRQWGLVKSQIKKSTSKMDFLANATLLEQKAIGLILESSDPKSIFALADTKLGKTLLAETTWVGTLDFEDGEAISRFISVMGK